MDKYNQNDIKKYYGASFFTTNGSTYGITKSGLFTGNKELIGSKVKMIAGIKGPLIKKVARFVKNFGKKESVKNLEEIINKSGAQVREGLHLVCILEKGNAKIGFYSSTLNKVNS